MTFKPNLAGKYNPAKLTFPVLASPKLDGIRAMARGGRLVSRKLLDIPNKHTFARFAGLDGFDGELIMGEPFAADVYNRTTRAVMKIEGTPDVTFWVFDMHDMEDSPYSERLAELVNRPMIEGVKILPQTTIQNQDMLDAYEAEMVDAGYEGIMLRDPAAHYKYGRSTANEGGLLKVKRYEDSEAHVIDIVEELHNGNDAQRDELGRTKRSSAAAGKIGKGTMGALHVKDIDTGVDFFCGAGFSASERVWWWKHRKELLARSARPVLKYKFFPIGVKDKPRHPVSLGLRSEIDL